mgnify:CR=1 FL=1
MFIKNLTFDCVDALGVARFWAAALGSEGILGVITGVLLVAFPLYVTFIASTLTLEQIMQVPMQLTPGDQLVENYSQVLFSGTTKGVTAPVGRMMFNSLVMALVIAFGKIAISIIAL